MIVSVFESSGTTKIENNLKSVKSSAKNNDEIGHTPSTNFAKSI